MDSSRIDEIIETAVRAATGDDACRAEVSVKEDPYDLLARAINKMAADLQEKGEEQKRTAEELRRAHAEYIWRSEELNARNEEIEAYSNLLLKQKAKLEKHAAEIGKGNKRLEEEIASHKRTEDELRRHRDQLEGLVAERTSALQKTNEELQKEITEHKQTEKVLQEREEIFRKIFENANDEIVHTAIDGTILNINRKVEDIFGYKPEEVIGKNYAELGFLSPEDFQTAGEVISDIISGKPGRLLQFDVRHKNGSKVTIEVNSKLIIEDGEITGFLNIIRDITERKQWEEELKRAKNIAEESARAKSEFLANMSHEIRTPLNGVIGMSRILLGTELTPSQHEYSEAVCKCADTLLGLINDILDCSKIDAGKLELEILDFDLRTCLEEVGDMLAQKAHEKGLELAILIHYDVPTRVKGDPGRLRQVLINLVNNAIKFTEKGEVVIRASLAALEETRQAVRFEVADTGIGIPADSRDQLFDAFSQVDASTTRKYGGTGLGLTICRQLVKAMGGTIDVKSEEGRGSTFFFTAVFQRKLGEESPPEPVAAVDIWGLRVLVVDDNATNRLVFREQLKAWGCRTEETTDCHGAVAMLRAATDAATPFQLALIDYHMPSMDGEELARRIKSDPAIAQTPLILVTSIPERGDATRMLEAGFDAYLTKPVKQSHLYNAIATVMGLRQAEDPAKKKTLITRHTLSESICGRYRILVVEDDIMNQKVAAMLLERAGFRCDVAADGLEALEALSRIPYDLVFMDCQMPQMDGYEATQKIREREGEARHTTIIAMTAHAMKGDRERCLGAGMDDYVSKPVSEATLYKMLEKWLVSATAPPMPPTNPEIHPTAPVQIWRLQEIAGGDLDVERELIHSFLEDSKRHLSALESARRASNAEMINREAHAMKGSSATIGAEGMSEIAHRLERMGLVRILGPADEALAALRSEFERVSTFFTDYLNA